MNVNMPRAPFNKTRKFGDKTYSFHSISTKKRLAEQKVKTLRNKGLNARIASKKAKSGGTVYAVYESRKKR